MMSWREASSSVVASGLEASAGETVDMEAVARKSPQMEDSREAESSEQNASAKNGDDTRRSLSTIRSIDNPEGGERK